MTGHGHGPRAFVNNVPVGRSGILLGAGAPVNGDHGNSLILQQAARVHGAQALKIPANTYFGRDGDSLSYGFHDASGNGSQQGKIFQEGGTSIFANHLGNRAAEVDIDKIRLLMVQDNSGRLSHVVPIRSEELDALWGGGHFLSLCTCGFFPMPGEFLPQRRIPLPLHPLQAPCR